MSTVAADPAVVEPRRVLFIDDDRLLLDGLRDALRPYRRQWAMSFVASGEEALAMVEEAAPDVVISDLRMPGLDGASLLELISDRSPSTVRIVLSGHADVSLVARAAATAHRLIPKPCETEELARVIERSCALHRVITCVELDRRAIGASALPSVPRIYAQLTAVLGTGSAGAREVAGVIEHDIAMSAKVLQLANSAYFGRRSPITGITQAVAYLGTDTLRALVLHAEAAREFRIDPPITGFDLERLHRHSTRVARLASELLAEVGGGGEAFAAGLLHDVGLLVLAAQDPSGLMAALQSARQQGRPIHEVEREDHGVTHAEIGAHLLALWGIPHTIAEAVAGHHDSRWLRLPFDPVAAVYIANTLITEVEVQLLPGSLPAPELDTAFIERAGLADRVPGWRDLAARQCGESGESGA
ncbi:MAG TPA: HDOD domain-containing protein [Solirubrobacteraceae bacterium]|nr:HDOD domain-containing protein [Solirubrobacteraceae bacterium]